MLKSSLCEYSDAYILVKGTTTVIGVGANAAERATDKKDKQLILKNCALFTDCTTEIKDTQVDHVRDIDVVIPKDTIADSKFIQM